MIKITVRFESSMQETRWTMLTTKNIDLKEQLDNNVNDITGNPTNSNVSKS